MAAYRVDIVHKFPQKKEATRNVFLDARGEAEAKKLAIAVITRDYPKHTLISTEVVKLTEPFVTQGLKFMPNVYKPKNQRIKPSASLGTTFVAEAPPQEVSSGTFSGPSSLIPLEEQELVTM